VGRGLAAIRYQRSGSKKEITQRRRDSQRRKERPKSTDRSVCATEAGDGEELRVSLGMTGIVK
jgi:hypothetical protein